jgi:hypothetical protein
LYGLSHQGPPSAVAYGSNYAPLPSSTWPSSNKQEVVFPERPGQPECHHYMKTGTCKFGATCKYNHPQYLSTPRSNYMLSPLGLPIRPVSWTHQSVFLHLSTMFSPRKLVQKHTTDFFNMLSLIRLTPQLIVLIQLNW